MSSNPKILEKRKLFLWRMASDALLFRGILASSFMLRTLLALSVRKVETAHHLYLCFVAKAFFFIFILAPFTMKAIVLVLSGVHIS